jgi:acyl carrier protein
MTTFEKVCSLILKLKKKNIVAADLKPEALLVQDLKLDSLDYSELLVMAEDAFAVKLTHDDLGKLQTIASLVEFVDKHTAGAK